MTVFPCSKINLGLNIVSRREDGYHNLETVFYPIPLCDAMEIYEMDEQFPSMSLCDLKVTDNAVECNDDKNLVVRAYNLLAKDHQLPRLHIHLHKSIPSQAGLGGGSSDGAYMIRLLNDHCQLHLSHDQMVRYAAQLGADCPFFIASKPAYATGIGDVLTPDETLYEHIGSHYIAIIKPAVAVSTKEAYAAITPRQPAKCCRDIVHQPVQTWKDELFNDFEQPVFAIHPQLKDIKDQLYRMGAIYAQMSGSGSAIFGIFAEEPHRLDAVFPDMYTFLGRL